MNKAFFIHIAAWCAFSISVAYAADPGTLKVREAKRALRAKQITLSEVCTGFVAEGRGLEPYPAQAKKDIYSLCHTEWSFAGRNTPEWIALKSVTASDWPSQRVASAQRALQEESATVQDVCKGFATNPASLAPYSAHIKSDIYKMCQPEWKDAASGTDAYTALKNVSPKKVGIVSKPWVTKAQRLYAKLQKEDGTTDEAVCKDLGKVGRYLEHLSPSEREDICIRCGDIFEQNKDKKAHGAVCGSASSEKT